MQHYGRNLCRLSAILFLLICQHSIVINARTHYEIFETSPNTGDRLCTRDGRSQRQPAVNSSTCQQFCQIEMNYANGGCDCKTLECICSNAALDFCNFQVIRVYI